jgi:hypothetical protein
LYDVGTFYSEKLKHNHFYQISGGRVKQRETQYPTLSNNLLEIMFDSDTTPCITEVEQGRSATNVIQASHSASVSGAMNPIRNILPRSMSATYEHDANSSFRNRSLSMDDGQTFNRTTQSTIHSNFDMAPIRRDTTTHHLTMAAPALASTAVPVPPSNQGNYTIYACNYVGKRINIP